MDYCTNSYIQGLPERTRTASALQNNALRIPRPADTGQQTPQYPTPFLPLPGRFSRSSWIPFLGLANSHLDWPVVSRYGVSTGITLRYRA